MLYLKEANEADLEKEYLFVREMPVDENGLTNKWNGISRDDFAAKALPEMLRFARGENLPEGFVPETFYFLWQDDEIIGQFRLRHCLCDSLREGGGHIGYFIKKAARGKGYGTKGLALLLPLGRAVIPEEEFYLRVLRTNPASLQVMLHNGGYLHHSTDTHHYVRIPK